MNSNYATMRFEPEALHGANAGLNVARELMEKVKQEYPWISYGDLWTLAGVAAIQVFPCSLYTATSFPYLSHIGNGWPQDSLAPRAH